jgi:hypothetical protein
MLGRQAKIVAPATLRRMLAYARQARQPKRDTVIVLLSVKAGLRACEIAGLQCVKSLPTPTPFRVQSRPLLGRGISLSA